MGSAQESGIARIQLSNISETNVSPAWDRDTSIISGGASTAPTGATLEAIPVAGNHPFMGKRLILSFITDSADTIESEESGCEIPVLIVSETTRQVVGRKTLKLSSGTGFTPAGTVDIACGAGVPHRVCYWDAGDGELFKLDPMGKVRVYFGDDTG